VDCSIQEVGFMPAPHTYGTTTNGAAPKGTNAHDANGQHANYGHSNGSSNGAWRCSDKQRDLIEKIVQEKDIDKNEVEQLALDMFRAGVRQLDRLQASGLIDELFERYNGGARRIVRSRANGNGSARNELATAAAQVRTVSRPAAAGGRPS
jgi:hypothetical protein